MTLPKREDLPEFLDRLAVAKMLNMSPNWVGNWAKHPGKPRHVVYARRAWYRRDEVLAWLNTEEGSREAHNFGVSQRMSAAIRGHNPTREELAHRFDVEWGSDTPEVLRLVPDPAPEVHRDEVDEQADFSFVTADRHATVADAIAALDNYQLKVVQAFIDAVKAIK